MLFSLQFLFLLLISFIAIATGHYATKYAEDEYGSYGKIIFSSLFARHGDRAPIKLYSSDPHNNDETWNKIWPQGKENLSAIGRTGSNNLGKWFRKRYSSLVNRGDIKKSIKVDSTVVSRTIMSAKCFLHGFFHPSENETCTEDVLENDPPVKINSCPILGFREECKKYRSEWESFNTNNELRQFYLENQSTFEIVEEKTETKLSASQPVRAIEKAYVLYDMLHVENLYELPLPSWVGEVYHSLKKIVKRYLPLNVRTDTMKRLRVGPLIGMVIQDMGSKIQGELQTVLHLYSGHESTVAALLDTLIDAEPGTIYDDFPSYSASIFFELRLKEGVHVVTIAYRDTPSSKPQLLKIKGCNTICTFEEFKLLFNHMIPGDWKAECDAV